jgi:DNA-binding GntR family transcriptional regulator
MKFQALVTHTLRQQVYDQLREKIISAGLLPGAPLSLRGLAEEFGVSQMPIREALWQLESERVVVIETNRRIRVNTVSLPEVQEIFRMRLLLETLAAEQSCDTRPDSALPQAKALLDQTAASLMRSPTVYIKANSAFHHLIYSYGSTPVLMRHIDLLWARVGPYFYYMQVQKDVDLSGIQRFHEAMYDAWAARDKARMTEALRGDLTPPPIHVFQQKWDLAREAANPAGE